MAVRSFERNGDDPGGRLRRSSDCPLKEQIVITARRPVIFAFRNDPTNTIAGEAP